MFREQKMPTFAQFLEVARTTGKNVIFDVREPPSTHPHISDYINKSLETVLQSGIDLRKVAMRLSCSQYVIIVGERK